jgi:putative flippase GtrA
MSNIIDVRFLKFGLAGLSGMVIDFGITWICKEKLKLNKYISNSMGFCFAVTNNFLLNRYWTFENASHPFAEQFVTFTAISLTCLIVNNILLYLLVKYFKAGFYFLKLIAIGLVFFWNYFLNFLFTFN